MRSTSKELKLRAKSTLRSRFLNLILIAAVFMVANFMLSYLAAELDGSNEWSKELLRRFNALIEQIEDVTSYEQIEGMVEDILGSMPPITYYSHGAFGIILSALVTPMSIPLSAGYVYHILQESRGVQTHVTSLLFGFRVLLKAIAMQILIGLLTFFGGLLFVIPGIILALRYSMSVMILVDDPTRGPIACMKESARIMKGNKWRFFKLQFSFILWLFAASLVEGLVGAPILNVYLTPYLTLAEAEFYKEIAIPQTEQRYQGPEIM